MPHAPRQQSHYEADWQALSYSNAYTFPPGNQLRLVAPSVALLYAARPVETERPREKAKKKWKGRGSKVSDTAGNMSVAFGARTLTVTSAYGILPAEVQRGTTRQPLVVRIRPRARTTAGGPWQQATSKCLFPWWMRYPPPSVWAN